MEIDAEFDFTYNTDGYPGSQYCLGDNDFFQCMGSPGASTNVQAVRFATQSNSNSVHTTASSYSSVSAGEWTRLHSCRSDSNFANDGNFSAQNGYGYLEVQVGGL